MQSYNGVRDKRRYTPDSYDQPLSYRAEDKSATYLEARFSEADSIAYESEVRELVASKYIDDPADTTLITAIINDAYFERLEKYLYFAEPANGPDPAKCISSSSKKSFICINPEQKDHCQIILSSIFLPQEASPVRYRILDLDKTVLCFGTLAAQE